MSRNAKLVAVDDALYAAAREARRIATPFLESGDASERDHAREILDVCKAVIDGSFIDDPP